MARATITGLRLNLSTGRRVTIYREPYGWTDEDGTGIATDSPEYREVDHLHANLQPLFAQLNLLSPTLTTDPTQERT